MPNLYNTDLGQNARRLRMSNSRFGTRRIQFYSVYLYGISDAELAKISSEANIRNLDGDDRDSWDDYEYTVPTVLEAMIRGFQKMGEVYIVSDWESETEDPDYNDVFLTVGLASDTIESNWEQFINAELQGDSQNYNPRAQSLEDAIGDSVDAYLDGNYDYLDVLPMNMVGDRLDSFGPFAMGRSAEVQAVAATRKAQIANTRTKPARLGKRNGG